MVQYNDENDDEIYLQPYDLVEPPEVRQRASKMSHKKTMIVTSSDNRTIKYRGKNKFAESISYRYKYGRTDHIEYVQYLRWRRDHTY